MMQFKKMMSLVLALVLVAGMLPAQAFAAETEPVSIEETVPETEETAAVTEPSAAEEEWTEQTTETEEITETEETAPARQSTAETIAEETAEVYVGQVELPDEDVLYGAYLHRVFFGEEGIAPLGVLAREMLSDADRYVYDEMKKSVALIAKGQQSSTVMRFYVGNAGFKGSQVNVDRVIEAMVHDCPYEMYWIDWYWWGRSGNQLDIALVPRKNYQAKNFNADFPKVDTEQTGLAAAAVANAHSIVEDCASYSDYDKLAAYADKICALVEYDNHAAEHSTWDININPWTLVNVFDGDPDTNVVCEGYAEAFQYLCDLSTFDREIACYSPTGANHKWNIVRINGVSYLMDVTHCDKGQKAERKAKFLGGGKGSVANGYQIGGFHYWYYDETKALWGTGEDSILRLSETAYDPAKDPDPPKVIASGTCGAELTWELDNAGKLTISGSGAMDDFASGSPWDSYREQIKEVVIPDGMTRICDYAFYNFKNMQTIELHDGIRKIGEGAFEGCESLQSIHIPAGLTGIEDNTFACCKSLTGITLPDGLEELGKLAFYGCESLTDIVIPDKVTVIGANAFGFCSSATTLVLGKSVREIRYAAFSNCKAITSVEIPNTVEILGEAAFVDCWGLKTIEIPGSVEEVGPGAFSLCKGLETVVIHEGVQRIGNHAFNCAKALNSVTLPDSVKEIGEQAFSSCWMLEEIVIPKNTESIGKYAFDWCKALKKVVFMGKAPSIDEEAFGDFATPQTGVKATVYYPCDRSWTEDKLENYGGKLQWVMDRTLEGHDVVADAAVAPGCIISGLAEGSHCYGCGEIVVEQEMIPATGHDFVNGFCTKCGGEDKADHVLFSGKTMTLQEMDPATGKAYAKNQITWTLSQGSDGYATLTADGKLTAAAIYEQVRIEAVATIPQEKKQIIRLIDLGPAISGLNVTRDGEVVNGRTVNMDFTDETLVLTVQTLPYAVADGVTWTVSDKKGQYATYEINGNVLTISNPTGKAGTVTIKAAVDAGAKKNVSVKVAFGGFARTVKISEPEKNTLKGGESLTLTAAITEPQVISKPGIVWSISDKTAATVSGGKVKAKNVVNPTYVTVTATSKDGLASDSVTLRILPKEEGQLVIMEGDAFVTNANKTLDKGDTLRLTAAVITEGVPVPVEVQWSSSKAAIASADEMGLVTANGNGSSKITAQYGKMKAIVNVKVSTLARTVEITTKDGKGIIEEDGQTLVLLVSGKNVALTANILPKDAAKAVDWTVTEGGEYAKVANGKVTANKDMTDIRYITVQATAKDGSGVGAAIRVKIVPLASGIQLYREGMAVRSGSTYVHDMMQSETIRLSTKVYPASAGKTLELTSSSKKIADFVDGQLVCYAPGTVTITAKTLDGSNKKVSFKLTIVKKITSLSLKEGAELTVVGGQSLKLAPMIQVSPSDATNQKLTWSVAPNDYGVKINASGMLSTKKVKKTVTVQVMVSAQDDSGKIASFFVTITPA